LNSCFLKKSHRRASMSFVSCSGSVFLRRSWTRFCRPGDTGPGAGSTSPSEGASGVDGGSARLTGWMESGREAGWDCGLCRGKKSPEAHWDESEEEDPDDDAPLVPPCAASAVAG
jgi:hypothetical protein